VLQLDRGMALVVDDVPADQQRGERVEQPAPQLEVRGEYPDGGRGLSTVGGFMTTRPPRPGPRAGRQEKRASM